MGLYEVPLSMSLLGFGTVIMLANFHMCSIKLVLRAVFNMLVRNASPRGHMCFRCLMFSLLGPCELLFLLYTVNCLCHKYQVISIQQLGRQTTSRLTGDNIQDNSGLSTDP